MEGVRNERYHPRMRVLGNHMPRGGLERRHRIARGAAWILFCCTAALAETDSRLPAYVIELPESVADVFIADTGGATIYRYSNSGGSLSLAGEGYMSIGENGAGKERAWDRRTPLGIYFVVDQLDTTRMPSKYGITAFPLDYPNAWDRRNERTGDGIWVHGVQPGPGLRPAWDTDGCLALPNEDLERLLDRFVPLATPVIVTRESAYAERAELEGLRVALRVALDSWKTSLAEVDLHAYLSMYADDFSYKGMANGDWAALRYRNFADRRAAAIELDEITLLADPEVDGLFLSRFRQTTFEEGERRRLLKRLYWRRQTDGSFRIVAEDNG